MELILKNKDEQYKKFILTKYDYDYYEENFTNINIITKEEFFKDLGFDFKNFKIQDLILNEEEIKEFNKNIFVAFNKNRDWKRIIEYLFLKKNIELNGGEMLWQLRLFFDFYKKGITLEKIFDYQQNYFCSKINKKFKYKYISTIFYSLLEYTKNQNTKSKKIINGLTYKEIIKFAKRIKGSEFINKKDEIHILIPKNTSKKYITKIFKKHFYNKYRNYSEIYQFPF